MFIICLILLLTSCNKEKNCISNCNSELPKIVWRVPLGPQKYDQISQNPVLYKDKLVMGYQYGSQKEGYYIYDKNTGKVMHELKDIASFEPVSLLLKNFYVSKVGRYIRRINLDNYEVSLKELQNYTWSGVFMTPYNSKVYLPRYGREGFLPKENQFELIECEILNDLSDQTVYHDSFNLKEGVFGAGLGYLQIRLNQKDQKEIFYSVSMGFHPRYQKKNILKAEAYNLEQNKLIWSTGDFTFDSLDGSGGTKPIVIDDKIIFSFTPSYLICYDINNGEKLWTTFINEIGSLFAHGDKISIIDNNMGRFHLIDARTGKILNFRKLDHGNPRNWAFHNNTLYFTTASSKLYAIDANTHDIKWEIKSPNTCSYCGFGFQSPVVDAETNRLYITDGLEVICYQLD